MAFRIGVQTRSQKLTAYALGVVCLLTFFFVIRFVWSYLSPDPTPPPQPTAIVTTAPARTTGTALAAGNAAARVNTNLDPTLHTELMSQAESMTYTGKGRNIFSQNSVPPVTSIPKPIKPIRPVAVIPTGPPPSPPPPPIDLKFYGYSAVKSGAKKAFLLHGEDIFIANEGDIVDRRYRLVKIDPFSVQVEDLAYKDTQTLRLILN